VESEITFVEVLGNTTVGYLPVLKN